MAGYYKRRARPGPSKNEQKVQRSQEAAGRARSAGLLRDRYPFVERLAIQLQFATPQQQSFEQQTRAFGPSDACDFAVSCPGRCNVGSFDLAAKIQTVVEAREAVSESSGTCQEPLYAGSPTTCGFQLRCKIEATYLPQELNQEPNREPDQEPNGAV